MKSLTSRKSKATWRNQGPRSRLLAHAKRPGDLFGRGIINSGKEASHLLREFARITGFRGPRR